MAKEQDLAQLREEYLQLSARISRFSLVSLLLLFLLVMAFSRAFSRINGAEVRALIARIEHLRPVSEREPELSYVFSVLLRNERSAPSEGQAQPKEVSPLEPKQAAEEQKELEEKMEGLAEEWFSIHSSILGTPMNLDLRYWILLLPLLIGGGAVYLYILRVKQAVVAAIAAHFLEKTDAAEESILDRLLFEKPDGSSAYARFPARLEAFACIASVVSLSGYFLLVALPLWPLWDKAYPSILLEGLVTGTVYVAAGCLLIRSRLWHQAEDLTGVFRPQTWIDRSRLGLIKPRRWLSRLPNPLRQPRRKMLVGSALVLLTLFLSMTTSCLSDREDLNATRAKGYEVVLAQEDWMNWFTSTLVENDPWFKDDLGGLTPQMDRAAYTLSLILAIATLILLAIPAVSQNSQWWRRLALLAGCLGIYYLSDLFYVNTFRYPFPAETLVYHFSWVVPTILLVRFRFSLREDVRTRWLPLRRILLVLFLPGIFGSIYLLGVMTLAFSVYGYPVFLLGILLVAWGYQQLVNRFLPLPSAPSHTLHTAGR